MVLGLTINFFNLRVECKMLDYNYDSHKDTISNGGCVVPLRKEIYQSEFEVSNTNEFSASS